MLDQMLKENRSFVPNDTFKSRCVVNASQALSLEKLAKENPLRFWDQCAKELDWSTSWTKTLEWKAPYAKWFSDGKLNASFNCLDRHLKTRGNKLALIWESEAGEEKTYTYQQLYTEVSALASALKANFGLQTGDRVSIYMPLSPEAVIAMLACARLGLTHSVVFAGFSSNSLRDRIQDANCKLLFTADFTWRRGAQLDLLTTSRQATNIPTIVWKRNPETQLQANEKDWKKLLEAGDEIEAVALPAEHPLFFLYTSGTTGKPKGIVHSTGGYLTQTAWTFKRVFDLQENDRYWCTADIGWVTGHSYLVYGPLANGATCFLYEGALNQDQPWRLIEKHKLNIFYTAPTAIRTWMRLGEDLIKPHNLNSLRLLGSVGEPINPEAWVWYYQNIGKENCPVVDTWWQTETGSIMITSFPGVTTMRPGSATKPMPGIEAKIFDEKGNEVEPGHGGNLVITKPWPSILRGIHGDPERFEKQYWSQYPGVYFTGDGAHRDAQNYFWIQGRIDDVLNVSGHRLGTMEIESALVSHPMVAEAAVVGKNHEIKGQAVVAFVTPKENQTTDWKQLRAELKTHVAKEIGSLARPDNIYLTRSLPKTRSGKIMRRLLKNLAEGKDVGDTTTLENQNLVDWIEPKEIQETT